MIKLIETTAEILANVVVFALALALSTSLSCGGKVTCREIPRNQAAEMGTP